MTLAQLRATSHWCVTGTPTQNLCSVGESSAPSKAKMGKTNDSTDGDDLTRLGHIIANFIRCPPFHGGIRSFDDFVRSPYLQQQAGAAGRVASLLGRIMVRNRESDVAATITLPPMAERVQSLEFDALGRRTYNVLLALFGINSVLTEREHQVRSLLRLRLASDILITHRITSFIRDSANIFKPLCAI